MPRKPQQITVRGLRALLQGMSREQLNDVYWFVLFTKLTPTERLEMLLIMAEKIETRKESAGAVGTG